MPSDGFKGLRIYNTLTRAKEDFRPINAENVRMYVCGPTVYDYAHIGNARPAIVFDVMFRLLRHLYGEANVIYVRNITDLDDKINARALRDFGTEIAAGTLSLNEAIRKVTEPTYEQYQKDVTALGCLAPTQQPRATEFVLPREDGRTDMIGLIQNLIDRGYAYVAQGEVLFDTQAMKDYGQLSKRPLDEQMAGARIAVDRHKRHASDFVLWKQSSDDEPGWPAQFRLLDGARIDIRGRPGWHIECSAMSAAYLGKVFDIHGGGLDLIFPHHENEIAQSRCAHGTDVMANYWMHNGFLQVEGKKMSKSDGNFVTINELLATEKFGGRTWPGEVLRLAMLMTHYREPIDFSVRKLEEAENTLRRWKRAADLAKGDVGAPPVAVIEAMSDDLGTYQSFQAMSDLAGRAASDPEAASQLLAALSFYGFELDAGDVDEAGVAGRIAERLALIAAKDWASADRIRDELLAQGIQLKDGKDPATGERVTTWEVKR